MGIGHARAAEKILFNRDVRPILAENCYLCHGPDKGRRKAKLRLDVREVALERGAIVPGKPAESKLIDHIFAKDPDDRMPPPSTDKALTDAEKDLLKRWIAAGAQYQPHWAYIRLERPAVPQVQNSKWVREPIDAFILHALEARNIRPSREADKATLLRRLSLDLIGLPPTAEELKNFLADRSPEAYERQVNRLLASPHFGERMAVPWLDIVRYADTVGYHGDQNQNVFPYRDYVIDSFNTNKPFDQFTIEQIAGDLLPNATLEDKVATGFNRLNMVTREGGAQPKEYLAKYAADRVRTVSMAWLGSTMGCAECHDHKFDPFTSKDFYQMEAFFADIKEWGVYMDYDYTPNPDLKGFSNDHPFPPEVQVDSPYLERRRDKLRAQEAAVFAEIALNLRTNVQEEPAFQAWRQSSLEFLKLHPDGWAVAAPEAAQVERETNTVPLTNTTLEADGAISFESEPAGSLQVKVPLPAMWLSAIRVELMPQSAEKKDPDATEGKAKETSLRLKARLELAAGGESKSLPFYFADADHKNERYANGFNLLGVTDLWKLSKDLERQTAVWLLKQPLQTTPGEMLVVDLGKPAIASVRISVSPFAAEDPLASGVGRPLGLSLQQPPGAGAAQSELVRAWLLSTGWDRDQLKQIRKLQAEIRECRDGRAMTLVTEAREPRTMRVLHRGNWQDETGEIVQPAAPHFLPQIPNPEGRRLTRFDLAHWLVSPDNPLTARAVMNRLWKELFGSGISAVVDDLGVQGEWPSHPDLLDWLACEFMQPACYKRTSLNRMPPRPWDIKHMVKLMVMSAAYRQDSNQRPDLKEIDPNNRLLACQSPRRLEAEFIRDNALAIAGLLNPDLGGPSFHPYQPAGYYAYLQFPDRDYYPELDERQYRRGLYAHWQRTFLQPMLANFDAPSREECTANRVVSDTPQQALTLLNDPTFVECARVWAAHLLSARTVSDEQRLDGAFLRAVDRKPSPKEKASLLAFLQTQREHYAKNSDEGSRLEDVGEAPAAKASFPGEQAAWTQVCRVILNLHETITRY